MEGSEIKVIFQIFPEMTRWCFLAFFILTSSTVAGQSTTYVLKGLGVNLRPGITGIPEHILWMHKGYKVVEFNSQEEHVYDQFKNRITLNWHTAELSITYLGFDDSGDYVLEAWMDRKVHQSLFHLEVIDAVPKPTISCEMTNGSSSSNMFATLVCAAEPRTPQSLIRFEWSSHGNTQPGSKLTIPLGKENDDEVYSCTVSNALSAETATFTAKDCYSDCSSVAPIIIPVILVIALLLVGLVVLIMCCKRHRKACFAEVVTGDVKKQLKSGVTQGAAEEAEPLVYDASPLTFETQQHQGGGKRRPDEAANSPRGDTDSDQDSAEVNNKDSQAKTPQKGYVKKMKGFFDSTGTKESLDKKCLKVVKKDLQAKTPQKGYVKKMKGLFDSTGTKESPDKKRLKEKDKHKPEETFSPSPSQQSEAPSPSDQNNLSSSDKGDSAADQLGKQETEFPHSDNDAVQPDVLSSNQDTESNVESSTSPEQPGSPEETEPLVNKASTPSSNQQQHQGGGKLRPNEAANSPREDTDSDQDSAEVNNKDSQAETPQKGIVEKRRSLYEPPGTKESPGKKWLKESKETDEDEKGKSPTDDDSPAAGETTDEQKEDANSVQIHGGTEGGSRDSSPSNVEKTNKSDDSLKNGQSTISSEQEVSVTAQHQQDSDLSEEEVEKHEDKEQESDRSGSAAGNGSQSGGNSADEDEQPGEHSSTSAAPDKEGGK